MLINKFDFKLASYFSFQDVNLEEVRSADLVEISGFAQGGIYHSKSMFWVSDLSEVNSATQLIRSKKERKAVFDNRLWFEEKGFEFRVTQMNQATFEEFEILYSATTLSRPRAEFFSLKEQILGKILVGKKVYLIGMYLKDILESGLVFSISDEGQAVVSFGAKKKSEERRGGVGGVFEQLLIDFCLSNKIVEITHGRSLNPAGITGKAGIFEFKARYGCSAFPDKDWKTSYVLSPKIALSDLVFVGVVDSQIGYTVVTQSTDLNIQNKYQTREIKTIRVLSFDEAIASSKKALGI